MIFSVLAGLIALAASACAVAPATAGDYDVWSCRGPVDQPLGMSAWQPRYNETDIGDFWVDFGCPSGEPFEMNMNTLDTGDRRPNFSMVFDLPAGATISSYRLFRAIETAPPNGPIYDYAGATREGAYPPYSDSGCMSTGVAPPFACQNQGFTDPLAWDDPANEVDRNALTLDGLTVWIGCVAADGCNPGTFLPVTALYALHQSRVTINDPTSPAVAGVSGTLTEGDPLWGKANLMVEATDTISGIRQVQLEIDGVVTDTNTIGNASCSIPYEVTRPCPSRVGKAFTVDTSVLAEGTHTAGGTVTDASGNSVPFGPVGFTVQQPDPPGPPPPSNGTPAVSDPVLTLDSSNVWHAPGRPAVVRGRLATTGGVAIAGAALEVEGSLFTSSGNQSLTLSSVTTGPDGRFQISTSRPGAKTIAVSFVPSAGQAATARKSAQVRNRLRVRLQVKPGRVNYRGKVRFKGRIEGAGPASRGIPVDIEAKVGGKWQTVATVSTRANGAFTWPYRFRHVKRDAIFSFRAIARAVPGWPWPSTKSPVRKVRIKVPKK